MERYCGQAGWLMLIIITRELAHERLNPAIESDPADQGSGRKTVRERESLGSKFLVRR